MREGWLVDPCLKVWSETSSRCFQLPNENSLPSGCLEYLRSRNLALAKECHFQSVLARSSVARVLLSRGFLCCWSIVLDHKHDEDDKKEKNKMQDTRRSLSTSCQQEKTGLDSDRTRYVPRRFRIFSGLPSRLSVEMLQPRVQSNPHPLHRQLTDLVFTVSETNTFHKQGQDRSVSPPTPPIERVCEHSNRPRVSGDSLGAVGREFETTKSGKGYCKICNRRVHSYTSGTPQRMLAGTATSIFLG
jgi:hypothetical protein